MPVEVIMPKVDMDMETGRISAWHVEEGAKVSQGDPLFDIETDKAAMEVESPADGTLRHVEAGVGDEIPIGQAVAWIYADGEATDSPPGAGPEKTAAPADTPADAGKAPTVTPPSVPMRVANGAGAVASAPPSSRPRATPLARRMARRHGIDLAQVRGTGPLGRIGRVDIEAFATQKSADASVSPEPAPSPRADRAAAPQMATSSPSAGLAVHYGRARGARPVLMLHGMAGDSTGWTRLERALGDVPTIKIDLPAHGASPHDASEDFADLAGRVVAAVDAADLTDLHLVGHSLGGAVALALADARPDRVASLTLLAPAGLGAEIDANVLHGLVRASKADSLAPWLKRLVADPERVSWDYVKAVALARSDARLREAQATLTERLFPDGTQGFDVGHLLERVAVPTRIVWGRADAIAPWKQALRAPGHVALHLLPGVGHMPQMEAASVVADIVHEQRGA